MPHKSPEVKKAYNRKYYLAHRKEIIKHTGDNYRADKSKVFAYNRTRGYRLKLEVLTYYGPDKHLGCCWSSCEIIDIDMLTIDHINNDGAEDRKKGLKGVPLYGKLKKLGYPEGYQTLCANHQLKKELLRKRKLRGEEC